MSTIFPTEMNVVEENYGLATNFEYVRQPSYTHKLNGTTVVGCVDNLDAYKQAVFKILNTERYEYIIYSWDYGVELKDLIGQPIYYVVPELEARITEAIMQDDRTISVSNFEFDTSKLGVVAVSFECTSIYGEIEMELSVEI